MLKEGFDITLDPIKGEGCDRLLLAELSIFLIETEGKISPMCLCNDIVSTNRQEMAIPNSGSDYQTSKTYPAN